jgi:hypothetical protein
MKDILNFLERLPRIPMEYVLALVAFAAIGLAVFALHVIHSIVMRGKSK